MYIYSQCATMHVAREPIMDTEAVRALDSEAAAVTDTFDHQYTRKVWGQDGYHQLGLSLEEEWQLATRRKALIRMEQCSGWPLPGSVPR